MHLRVGLPVLLVAPLLVLLAAIAAGAIALVGWRRKKGGELPARGKLRRAAPWALLTVVISLVASAAYVLVAVAMQGAVGGAPWALPLVQLLGISCCAAALVLLADSALAWRERQCGAGALTVWTLGALGALVLSWRLITFGLAGVPGLA